MPRRSNPVPTYRPHRPSGRAVTTVRSPDGRRSDLYLGRYGSPESRAEYSHVLAELKTAPAGATAAGPPAARHGPTVNEVLLAFLKHADAHYRRPAGTPTSEPKNYREALKPVRGLYAHTIATQFGGRWPSRRFGRRWWTAAGAGRW